MATIVKSPSSIDAARTAAEITNAAYAIDGNLSSYAEQDVSGDSSFFVFIDFPEFSGNEVIEEVRIVCRTVGQDYQRIGVDSFYIYDYASGGSGDYYRGRFHALPYTTSLQYMQWVMTPSEGRQENITSPTVYNTMPVAWGRNTVAGGTLDPGSASKWRDGLYIECPLEYNGYTGRYSRCYDVKIEIDYIAANLVPVNDGGIWKDATPYAKDGGIWKEATPSARDSGIWKPTV